MSSTQELDLRGVALPVCLLKCKEALSNMTSGQQLQVLLQDPEALNDLVRIVERSRDQLTEWRKEEDHYRIIITPHGGSKI